MHAFWKAPRPSSQNVIVCSFLASAKQRDAFLPCTWLWQLQNYECKKKKINLTCSRWSQSFPRESCLQVQNPQLNPSERVKHSVRYFRSVTRVREYVLSLVPLRHGALYASSGGGGAETQRASWLAASNTQPASLSCAQVWFMVWLCSCTGWGSNKSWVGLLYYSDLCDSRVRKKHRETGKCIGRNHLLKPERQKLHVPLKAVLYVYNSKYIYHPVRMYILGILSK